MSITWDVFQNAYKNASAEKQALIDSGLIHDTIARYVPPETAVRPLMLAFSYHILGLLGASAVIHELEYAHIENAHLLFSDILKSIESASVMETSTPVEPVPEREVLETEIVETEMEYATLQGIRTMARDMQAIQHPEEPTYRSTQSDILDRNNGPRWDTEQ